MDGFIEKVSIVKQIELKENDYMYQKDNVLVGLTITIDSQLPLNM